MLDFDGYESIGRSSTRAERIFWVMALVLFFCVGILWNVLTIRQYILDPTTISIDVVDTNELQIPDIQICTMHGLNITKLLAANYSLTVVRLLRYYFGYRSFHSVMRLDTADPAEAYGQLVYPILQHEEANAELEAKIEAENLNFYEFIMNYDLDCEDVLLECRLGWKVFNCCDHIITRAHEEYGKCFVLTNLTEVAAQEMPGESHGLKVLVDNSPDNRTLQDQLDVHSLLEKGAMIEIASNMDHPSQVTYKVSSGKSNFFAIKAVKYQRSSAERSCVENTDGELPERGCMAAFRQQSIAAFCNCIVFGHVERWIRKNESFQSLPTCLPREAVRCLLMIHSNASLREKIHGNARTKCSRPLCNQWTYEVNEMKAELDTRLISRMRRDDRNRDYALVSVYYSDMTVEAVTEVQTVTFDTVVSNIGGNMSLFIGGSIITLVQVLVLLVKKLARWVRCKASFPLPTRTFSSTSSTATIVSKSSICSELE